MTRPKWVNEIDSIPGKDAFHFVLCKRGNMISVVLRSDYVLKGLHWQIHAMHTTSRPCSVSSPKEESDSYTLHHKVHSTKTSLCSTQLRPGKTWTEFLHSFHFKFPQFPRYIFPDFSDFWDFSPDKFNIWLFAIHCISDVTDRHWFVDRTVHLPRFSPHVIHRVNTTIQPQCEIEFCCYFLI